MAETSYIIQNGKRLNLKDATARSSIGSCEELETNAKHCLVHAINELSEKIEASSSGVNFITDETLTLNNGVLSVNMAHEVEDKTLPISAAAVNTTVGNIEVLLKTI